MKFAKLAVKSLLIINLSVLWSCGGDNNQETNESSYLDSHSYAMQVSVELFPEYAEITEGHWNSTTVYLGDLRAHAEKTISRELQRLNILSTLGLNINQLKLSIEGVKSCYPDGRIRIICDSDFEFDLQLLATKAGNPQGFSLVTLPFESVDTVHMQERLDWAIKALIEDLAMSGTFTKMYKNGPESPYY